MHLTTPFLTLVAVVGLSTAAPAPRNRNGAVIPGQFIVQLAPQASVAENIEWVKKMIEGPEDSFVGPWTLLDRFNIASKFKGYTARLNPTLASSLSKNPNITSIEPDRIIQLAVQPGVDSGAWGIDRIDGSLDGNYNFPDAAGAGVDAYVIDTGIEVSHPQFEGRARWGGVFASGDMTQRDGNGHGTHVAGTIGSKSFGVAKRVNLIAVKVLGSDGSGSNSDVIRGINFVAQQARSSGRKSVANMSLGGGKSSAVEQAAQALLDAGVALAVAAGNTANEDACNGSPSGLRSAYTVAASDINSRFASFSDIGSCVDIIAPGVNIKSTWINGGTNTISGTSMATPHTTGVLALAYSVRNFGSPAEAFNLLTQRGQPGVIKSVPSGTKNLFLSNNVQ
ncbi:subtilisin-like serine protease [Borealophlyctis nickersoniae]|nr:subtilisin-like serine protease [Borealophlyctis nickersoniae]